MILSGLGRLLPRKLRGFYKRTAFRTTHSTVAPRPTVVDVEPSTKCNLACTMCQVPGWDRRHLPNLTLEDFRRFVDTLLPLKRIKLQGMGEPFLNKELFAMVRYAAEKNVRTITNTNGTVLTDTAIRDIVEGPLDSISFSIDAATKETYERIRRGGDFEKVIGNLKRLLQARNRGSRRFRVKLTMTGMRENIHEAPALVQTCLDLGVDRMTLRCSVTGWGNRDWERKNREKNTSVHDEASRKHILEAIALAEKHQFDLLYTDTANRYDYREGRPCHWPWRSAYVTVEGDLCPCCIMTDPRTKSFGNLHRTDFDTLWKSADYSAFRRAHLTGRIPPFCRGCYESA